MSSSPDDTTHLSEPHQPETNEFETLLPDWNEYKIESLLGEGGMGRVYKAYDPEAHAIRATTRVAPTTIANSVYTSQLAGIKSLVDL